MRIAVWHNLPSGGGKRSLFYHVKGLVKRGHTVESWCPSTTDRSYLPLNELITEHIIPFNWKPREAKTFVGKAINNYADITSKIAAMDAHCQQCADEINASDFDLLFVNPQ
ncbi:hypothetical protein [Chamaesiphon minutus]|uniref:Glycosyltransferase subfamily 4-like N-terminal domain-containing protein n=1 Tax=Chamaesiphon minutus (strain ATCC 27169 / PCC 6605) TaxID=1173020 RepID=K9UN28_CHAP6|nr:hypothetical protein [Chamaesiphon minutus]AFY95604.1 hypothetical protein Cha6605_4686 [Chamaesiphon minutus PCC 6605]